MESLTAQKERRRVTVEEYVAFRKHGFLVARGLVSPDEIEELRRHTEDLMQGRLPEQEREMDERDPAGDRAMSVQGLEAPPAHLSPEEKAQYFLRIHMLHRKLALHERYLLHPGVLDILEVLIGPDVLALQSTLFLKPAGKPGQGWRGDTTCHLHVPALAPPVQPFFPIWSAQAAVTAPLWPICPPAKWKITAGHDAFCTT